VETGAGAADADAAEMVRWRLRIAYNGSGFHGFAAQNGQATVAGALGDALNRFTQLSLTLTCAGRTDSGVHAQDQVVHVDLPPAVARRPRSPGPDALLQPAAWVRPSWCVRRGRHPPGSTPGDRPRAARYRYLVVNAPGSGPAAGRRGLARLRSARPPGHGRRL